MSKIKRFRPRLNTDGVKKKLKFYYLEKFFNKWMNKYDFIGLNYQQKQYIMKKLWAEGTVACSSVIFSNSDLKDLIMAGTIDMRENELIFTPWAFAERYDIYDFPTHARLINVRSVSFIPQQALELDKEVVIIYAQKNHKSILSSIEVKIDEVVDLEMKKRVALKAQSQPFLFTFSPEDYQQAKTLQEQMENDEPYIFVPVNEPDKAKGFTSGAPYIVDKLQAQIDGRVDEILTMLGVNNIGIDEKKEHLIVDEVNANNEDIEQQSYSYKNVIEDCFDRINSVFNKNIKIIDLNQLFKEAEDETEENMEDNEDDEAN